MSDSVIHDIGYQRYTGQRLGPRSAFWALFLHGLRAAFGLGRSAKAKIFPWIAIGLVGVAALIIAIARSQGEDEVGYQDLPSIVSVIVLVFLAVVAPELVSRDLRNNLLPLYFSRPVSRVGYAGAKLLSMIAAIWLMLAGPQLLIFAASAFGTGDVFAETGRLLGGWLVSLIYAAIFGGLGMLIASVGSRRAFAAGAIAAVFLVTLPVAGVLIALGEGGNLAAAAPLLAPAMLPEAVREAILSSSTVDIGSLWAVYIAASVAVPGICALLLMLRYRRVSL